MGNRSNYVKADILRPVLGPALGVGLTGEGETQRGLRQLISPVFDHRSVEGYVLALISVEDRETLKERYRLGFLARFLRRLGRNGREQCVANPKIAGKAAA